MRAVIDTNVIVSALRKAGTPPAEVLADAIAGIVVVLYDARILAEYRDVLSRPKLKIPEPKVEEFETFIVAKGRFVAGARFEPPLIDPDDQPFADVAFTGKADLLITGNTKHFPVDSVLRVVTPRDWVRIKAGRELLHALNEDDGLALTVSTPAVATSVCKQCGRSETREIFGLLPSVQPRPAPLACSECGGERWLTITALSEP